jgi:hypothetical protein
MFVYIRSEPGLWTVGHYNPQGKFISESDHDDREKAAERVSWLNGGKVSNFLATDYSDGDKDSAKEEEGVVEEKIKHYLEDEYDLIISKSLIPVLMRCSTCGTCDYYPLSHPDRFALKCRYCMCDGSFLKKEDVCHFSGNDSEREYNCILPLNHINNHIIK